MILGVLGDTHGNERWILGALERFVNEGVAIIIQVGDLGVWSGEAQGRMWNRVNAALSSNGQQLLVAPGNHENYDRIARIKPDAQGWLPFRERILLAPRGHRTAMGGRSFLWLGGAGSTDRSDRIRGAGSGVAKSWWPQEALTDNDVEVTMSGGAADIMVSHDAPFGVASIDSRLEGNPEGFEPADLAWANASRERFTTAFDAVRPQLLLHGHFHFPVDEVVDRGDFTCRVFGLACDEMSGALALLDLDSLDVSYLNHD